MGKMYAKRGAFIMTLLGLSMTHGAITHGNDPAPSIALAVGSLTLLVLLNIKHR